VQRGVNVFSPSALQGKAVLCHLLLARIALALMMQLLHAGMHARRSHRDDLEAPLLTFQTYFLMGDSAVGGWRSKGRLRFLSARA